MGYCPYLCIFCGDIEDNGWNGWGIYEDRASKLTGLPETYFKKVTEKEISLDVCDSCLMTCKCTIDPEAKIDG